MSGAWCPTCRDWSVAEVGQACAWCDTRIVNRRGGWKHKTERGRITRTAALAIHAKYQTGVSANALGKALYQTLGYPNPKAAAVAIGNAFRKHGLPVRDRIEATVLASTANGLSPRDPAERRRRRRAAGLVGSGERAMQQRQPRCAGVRQQYPRRGERCQRPALIGSEFCFSHDPERRAESLAIVERVRSFSPGRRRGKQLIGDAPFAPSS